MKQRKSRSVYGFEIAEHYCTITMSEDISIDNCLPTFRTFLADKDTARLPILSIDLQLDKEAPQVKNAKLLNDQSIVWEDRFCFEEWKEGYIATIESKVGLGQWKMYSSKDFRKSTIYGIKNELTTSTVLSWFFMVIFGQAALKHRTLLLHASVVKIDNEAVAFLGKSGTGKSTHSELWCRYIDNAILLNDDNPAIRIMGDGSTWIYGTPWSGKTPCYKQKKARLVGLVRLEQADSNYWNYSKPKRSLLWLLPSFSAIRWNNVLFEHMLNSLELIIKDVNVGKLGCKPDEEAVRISYKHTLGRKNKKRIEPEIKSYD